MGISISTLLAESAERDRSDHAEPTDNRSPELVERSCDDERSLESSGDRGGLSVGTENGDRDDDVFKNVSSSSKSGSSKSFIGCI